MPSQSLEPGIIVDTENKGLSRDTHSKALIASDRQAYNKYKVERAQKEKMLSAVDEINSLKTDMSELKDMVAMLLSTSRNN